jgi:hypothetical protein
MTVVDAVAPSSAVAVIVNSPGAGKQHGIMMAVLAPPEASVVAVIDAARKLTTAFGGKFSTLQVVSTLADVVGILVTSHVSVGEDGASPSPPISLATTMIAVRVMPRSTRRMANLRSDKNCRAALAGPTRVKRRGTRAHNGAW